MNDAIQTNFDFQGRPVLAQMLASMPRLPRVPADQWNAILYSSQCIGTAALNGGNWEDEPSLALLCEVPNMPQEHYYHAIRAYVTLLFDRMYPNDTVDVEEDALKKGMWDVICYLRRRLRCAQALERLAHEDRIPAHSHVFSVSEWKTLLETELPHKKSNLRDRFSAMLGAPFSHDSCMEDRAAVSRALAEERLLFDRLSGLLPPWKEYPDALPDSEGWQYGTQREYLERFVAYYRSLSFKQRFRLRKHCRETKAWRGWYTKQELTLLKLSKKSEKAMMQKITEMNRHLPAHICKNLADRFRHLSGEEQRGIIVYQGGTITRVFSDIEDAAIKEGTKSCIAFRKGENSLSVEKTNHGWLCSRNNLYVFIHENDIPDAGEENDRMLKWYATERIFGDAIELQPVLFCTPQGFSNLEQKRSIHRMHRREPTSSAYSYQISDIEPPLSNEPFSSSLREGARVKHRIWGTGCLMKPDLRIGDAFWQVRFETSEKILSEKWLLENCTIL